MRKSREIKKSKKMRTKLSFLKSVKIREKSSTMKWKKLFLGTTMRKMSLMISFLTVVSIFAVFYLMSINNQIDETILQANEYLEIEEEYRLVMSDIKQVISIQYDMMATGYTSQKQTHIDRIFENASNWEQAKQFLISEGLEAYVKQIEESSVSLFQLHQDYFQSYHSNWSEIVNRNISPIITPIDSHLTRIDNNITAHIREIIELNNYQVTQTLHESTIRTMILIAILFSIPAISMFLFAKDLNKGVSQLKAQMGKYENGDFYISRVTDRFDEMGELENSLEKMRSKIAENLTENKFISNKIVVTANEIENERKELSVKNEEMEEVIQKQQLLVQHQLQNAHSISAVTEESSASTLEIHHSLEELKKGMETMNLYASKGTTYITETEQNIDRVTNLMDFFLTQLEQVKENTNAIQRFMKHIFEISNQTNLLAINASIEAARAGTHGNGFKVVAQEVQNLSKQTNTFSVEIANQLSLINENVTNSLNGFTDLHQSIKQTKELSQTTSTQFKEVSSQSDKMLMQVFDVTSTMEEISKGTLEIVSSINDLADQSNVSEESVIVIKDISQSQSQATDILQRSVNELSLLAFKLQNQEERFSQSPKKN